MSPLWVSVETLLTIVVGLVISVMYARYMWLALQHAVRTRDEHDVGPDSYRHSLIGAVLAVVGAVAAISGFGAGPALLYVGPGLALSSAIAVSYCLRTEYFDE
jgi:hypothetical protein